MFLPLIRTIISFAFVAIAPVAWAVDFENYPSAQQECFLVPKFSADFCWCIIDVSKGIPENYPILHLFLVNARNSAEAKQEYNKILEGSIYSDHNFSNMIAKKDFIEGQARVFVHRLELKCADVD